VRRCSVCGEKNPNFAKRDNGKGTHSWCVPCKAAFDRDIERIVKERYERTYQRTN
jgi:transposase